jgi:predicted metal-dependent phosphoesterase TrpH
MNVEFHCHTRWSKDSLVEPEKLIAACRKKGIGKVVITDHNSIGGAVIAQKMAPDLVIIGEEIMTTRGELLAAFVMEEIPKGLSPDDVISRLRDQGAFISVSHPFDHWRNGAWAQKDLDAIIDKVDAIEVFNARCSQQRSNDLAQQYAKSHGILGTAGSDAHSIMELGRAVVSLPEFNNSVGLKEGLGEGKIIGKLSPYWVHFISRWASWRKMVKSSLTVPQDTIE